MRQVMLVMVLALVGPATVGCSRPKPTESGFLSDYSSLKKISNGHLRYVSDDLRDYSSFIVDPVEIRVERDPPVMNPEQRAEVARYLRTKLDEVLEHLGYDVREEAGVGTGRFRVAITDVQKAKWYLNLHPGSKLSGVGRGGASMEAEVVDSVTGEQLAAVVRAGRGSQFELDQFSQLDDVKDVIDRWAVETEERLSELREEIEVGG